MHANKERLQHLVRGFPGARIGVLGDFMLDEYVWGRVTRISPEAPVPIVEVSGESTALGGAGNVVMNIRALGGLPIPFGVVGDDDEGRKIVELMKDNMIMGRENVFVDPERPTTVKKRIVAHNQHVVRLDRESRSPLSESLRARILASLHSEAGRLSALIVSDYNKGAVSRPFFDQVFTVCQTSGLPVFLDPKAFDLGKLGPVMAVTPNRIEAEKYSGVAITNAETVERAGQALLAHTGAQHILVTRGEHGMTLFSARGPAIHLETGARQVYDVTGAGDTVVATLALAVAAGATLPEAADLANLGAGIVVGKVGTAVVTQEELISALNGNWPLDETEALRPAWAKEVQSPG